MSLHTVVQSVPCKSRNFSRIQVFKGLSKCHVCENSKKTAGARDTCRFVGRRSIVSHALSEPTITFQFEINAQPHYPRFFNRKFTAEDIQLKKRLCARLLLPVLLNERNHQQRQDLIIHSREMDERVSCDVCNTALFSQSWLCRICGRELCSLCHDAINDGCLKSSICSVASSLVHSQSEFYPISRFSREEIDKEISVMESLVNDICPLIIEPTFSKVPRLAQNVPLAEFKRIWSHGIPVVVTGVAASLQGDWSPEYFIEKYGTHKVTLIDCEYDCRQQSTVAHFFHDLMSTGDRTQILKLADWPPQTHFRDHFPELFLAFMSAVPFGDVTRLDGVLNMASHFPTNGVAPDLGPKMYIAYSSVEDGQHHGSTKLHIDITDAVNIMVWSSSTPQQSGYALWRIFPQTASAAICEYLRNHAGFAGPGHPIHSQTIYFTEKMLTELETLYGVQPFSIRQRVGEAIFIPAGCAHQVSNQADAIKIACDFISLANILQTQRVCNELRQHRLATGVGEDVLQFYTTLWHAWKWLALFTDTVNAPSVNGPDSSHLCRRKERKRTARTMRTVDSHSNRPGYDFTCFFCPRRFHRAGLLDHLKSTHPAFTYIDDVSESRLRKPRIVADDMFMQQLSRFVQTPALPFRVEDARNPQRICFTSA